MTMSDRSGDKKPSLKKRMAIMLIVVFVLIGAVVAGTC